MVGGYVGVCDGGGYDGDEEEEGIVLLRLLEGECGMGHLSPGFNAAETDRRKLQAMPL
jgi:hypothetical protein